MIKGIKPKSTKLSDVIEAAIKNIEQHIELKNGDVAITNYLLTDFAIQQLKEATERLRR